MYMGLKNNIHAKKSLKISLLLLILVIIRHRNHRKGGFSYRRFLCFVLPYIAIQRP